MKGRRVLQAIMMNMVNPYDVHGRHDVALSEISSQLIHQFHRHWLALCYDGALPSRSDIDPANFKLILPNVILAEIEQDPFRVRYRLCGSRVAEFCGNLTGRYLDQIGDPNLWSTAAYMRQYQVVVREARPVFSHDSMVGQFGVQHQFQTGIWPLSSDGHGVNMCVAVEDYLKLRRTQLEPSAVLHAL